MIEKIEVLDPLTNLVKPFVVIWHNETEYTSMPLLVWEQQQAEQNDRGSL